MRTTVTLDDELFADAVRLTGISKPTALTHAALTALVERESARRLAKLGGTMPDLQDVPRRRPPNFINGEPAEESNADQV